jgi:predicted nucleic acid-binding protein
VGDILAAIDLHRLHGLSFWDSVARRSAMQAGCASLFSEDLQENPEIDGARVINPFH